MESVENTWARKFSLCRLELLPPHHSHCALDRDFHTLFACSAFNTPTESFSRVRRRGLSSSPRFSRLLHHSFISCVFSSSTRVIARARLSLFLFPLERIINCVPSTQFNLRLIIYWHGKLICFPFDRRSFLSFLRSTRAVIHCHFGTIQQETNCWRETRLRFLHKYTHIHTQLQSSFFHDEHECIFKRARGSWWCPDYCQRWLCSTAD